MQYYQFKDYKDFQSIFGQVKHGNGEVSRKNKILLAYLKTPEILHEAVETWNLKMLDIRDMAGLKKYIFDRLSQNEDGKKYKVRLINYTFWSDTYSTDERLGICEDNDLSKVRYIRHKGDQAKPYKKKPGSLLLDIIAESSFGRKLPEQVRIYLAETITQEWKSYASKHLPKIRLCVDNRFGAIYSRCECKGDFGSCMTGKGCHTFYRDYVDANAAYLLNEEGLVIARCIIFNKVYDETGKVWRYAERQYATHNDDVLKRTLIDALIQGGYIDCYKAVGAGCHDSRAIVDIEGNSLSKLKFHIDCTACEDSTLSFQDTFKYLNVYKSEAYNYEDSDYDFPLDITYGRVGGSEDDEDEDDRPWSEYTNDYCDEVVDVHVHGSIQTCDVDCLEDFVVLHGEYYHVDDVKTCPVCGERFVGTDDDAEYSNLTTLDYCCSDCRDKDESAFKQENWYYSDYDEDYFVTEDELTTYMCYDSQSGSYVEHTISKESYFDLLDNGYLFMFDKTAFDKIEPNTGLPYGYQLVKVELANIPEYATA